MEGYFSFLIKKTMVFFIPSFNSLNQYLTLIIETVMFMVGPGAPCVLCLIDSSKSLHDSLLYMRSCGIKICFILPIETFLVGILYKDMHELLPDESQPFLDG